MFIVNKSSWHYRWMVTYNSILLDMSKERVSISPRRHPKDFCSYWRNVLLWPAIRIGLNLLAYAVMIMAMYLLGLSGFTSAGLGVAIMAGIFTALAIGYFIFAGIGWLGSKGVEKVRGDELIKTAYDSYKENYCPLTEYKDNIDV